MTALITDHAWRPDTWTPVHRRDPDRCQYAWCDRPREEHARRVTGRQPPPQEGTHPMICTVTPTVMDGTVVRWYSDEPAYEAGSVLVSASRNGVLVPGFLHEVPADLLAKANEAFEILRDNGPRELVQDMATHRTKLGGRLLMPILRGEQ